MIEEKDDPVCTDPMETDRAQVLGEPKCLEKMSTLWLITLN
ncbi:hypothetical protein [Pacificibacter sp. AS14]